ncbi:MAG: type IV-A pilus assembly ATPase PilB [Gammaproteobacteria bacterium]|nr:type IV-A pilus assembly ATPase PilB [Gammaproteobacteria bacterium]MDH5651499.1 type IV-A pilus assembly ATPase PilB [Gammaproteobacteria bacterium]
MATPTTKIPLSGLARKLVQDGLLSEPQAQKAHADSLAEKVPFVSYVVSQNLAKSKDVAQSASEEFGVPLLDIDAIDIDPEITKLVKEKLIRQHHALPIFKRGNRLYVAVSDPTNLQGLDEIKFHVGMTTEAILVQDDKLVRAIERSIEANDTKLTDLGDSDLDAVEFGEEADLDGDTEESDADDTPVVRFVNKVLLDAINKGASDIHFEPYEKSYRVRFRQDGVLKEVAAPPVGMAPRLAARIKVMSRLDISERRLPQDGRIKMNLSKNRAIDFRVNTCPTLYGEKIVLRILDPASAKLGVDALGFEPEQKEIFLKTLQNPYGMILVTGPTGSGKTVTLYTGVNILNQPGVNISTAEDPVEINMPGINQVNINPRIGLDFAKALRAFLRQDPDIILVGEIRDLETAEIGIKAAQTGHMVLSTLHTNDAPQTLTRLANMGVPPYNIASAVSLIIAQRLARRLCNHCKKPLDLPKEALLEEGFTEAEVKAGVQVYGPTGCDQCSDGYRGRVGIYQVMTVSEPMGRIIMEGGNAMQLADQARKEGVPDLRQSGLRKVKDGVTSLDEINRVTKD